MQKRISAFALAMLAVAGVLNLAACGGGSGGTVTVKSLALSPTAVSVPLGQTSELTLTVTFTNPSDAASTTPVLTYLVNGVAGGTAETGTIAASADDAQVAVYQAPTVAPGSNNNQVNITATTPVTPGSTTNTTIVTSNTAVVSLTSGSGLTVNPATAIVPAGGTFQFNAVFNDATDTSVTWSVAASGTANVGTINASTGLYTAPPFPPLGGTVMISATQDSTTASAVATIVYSAASLSGPFSFSYSGNDKTGFLGAAGSFQADGAGHIVSGVQDTDSFSTGPSAQVPISGTYTVAQNGRGTIVLKSGQGQGTTNTLQFVLSTNQHGLLTRFDPNFTGSGTLDQQNLDALSNSDTVVTGPYVFEVGGADTGFNPLGIAGRFTSNGSGGIPNTAAVVDVNDNGTIKSSDTTLAGSYSFDALFPGSGRGTLTLTSTSSGTIQYAFYVVDGTHLRLVEADTNAFLEGDAYSGAVGNSFSAATLANGNYPFTEGGNSPTGLYTAGGIFTADGAGNISGGIFDSNNAGTQTATGGVTMGTCTYTVNSTTSRIDLRLQLASGACGATNGPMTAEFVAYPTAKGPALLLEVDPIAVASGAAFLQTASPATFTGNLAFSLSGRGIIHNSISSIQGDVSGQIAVGTLAATSGALDINKFNAVYLNDLVNTATTAITAPTAPGRGTAVISGTNPNVTYNVVYYVISSNAAVEFSSDATRNMTGFLLQQF
ncbi:MAG TPA: hypothetical protein VGD60_04755 [Candidatus Acidoferrales bacterium]